MAYESTTFDAEAGMSAAEKVKGRAQDVMERAKARGAETMEDTVDMVRRHPGKTLAVSILVGGLIGAAIVAALTEDEPASKLDQWADLGSDAWEKVRGGALDAISAAKDAVDSALARFR